MGRVLKGLVLAGAAMLVFAPVPAHAEGFFVPWIGSSFSAGPDISSAQNGATSFGMQLGSIGGGGAFGFDVDFGYAKDFFGSNSNVIDVMANLIMGPAVTGSAGRGVRPYANFGIGLIRPKVGDNSTNNFGWNAAGGIFLYVSNPAGAPGDLPSC